jgi:putative transposase
MIAFIDQRKAVFGVEPICELLPIAPSTYYAAKTRPPSRRSVRDAELKPLIQTAWRQDRCLYGARKAWLQLRQDGVDVGRDRVARLMRDLGLCGNLRGKKRRTTIPDAAAARPADLVARTWTVTAPNRVWVADFTEVATWSGKAYVAFVIDIYSRMIVGWRVATTMRADLVLDALDMAVWRRNDLLDGLVCHSDAGSQYTSIRYTLRLAEIGAVPSVGSVGDPIDNAVAESMIGLYKSELIAKLGPWKTVDQLELETLTYVDWFNTRRIHSAAGDQAPARKEALYYQALGQQQLETRNRQLRASTEPRAIHSPANGAPGHSGSEG